MPGWRGQAARRRSAFRAPLRCLARHPSRVGRHRRTRRGHQPPAIFLTSATNRAGVGRLERVTARQQRDRVGELADRFLQLADVGGELVDGVQCVIVHRDKVGRHPSGSKPSGPRVRASGTVAHGPRPARPRPPSRTPSGPAGTRCSRRGVRRRCRRSFDHRLRDRGDPVGRADEALHQAVPGHRRRQGRRHHRDRRRRQRHLRRRRVRVDDRQPDHPAASTAGRTSSRRPEQRAARGRG